jgi:hypothetical protein
MDNEYEEMRKDIHGPIKMDMKEVLKNRRDYYLDECIFFEKYEKFFSDRLKTSMNRKRRNMKEEAYLIGMGTWIHFCKESELLYTILYQLIEFIEKNTGMVLNKIEDKTRLLNDEGMKWVLEDIHQMATQVEEKYNNTED